MASVLADITKHQGGFLRGKGAEAIAGIAKSIVLMIRRLRGLSDVFLSYRVDSDSEFVEVLYDVLTKMGLKVYLDKKCLQPGVPWEQGFCDGLVSSRVFVPVLSRAAINNSDKEWHNFNKLTANSSDNVLLEYRMALELKADHLVEAIYPVMIGDIDGDRNTDIRDNVYLDYFRCGCHPMVEGDVVVNSVEEKLREHLARKALGAPKESSMSVRAVLKSITDHQGGMVKGKGRDAISAIANTIYSMVRDVKTPALLPRDTDDLTVQLQTELRSLKDKLCGLQTSMRDFASELVSDGRM